MAVDFLALEPLVEKAARVAHSSFPAFHDVDDTKQHIWVWVYSKQNAIADIIRNAERRDIENKPVYELMLKEAYSFLKKEDAANHGYSEEDAFFYSRDLIEDILEVVFQHEDWQSFATVMDAMPKAKVDPATAGNNLASYVDVSRAVTTLKEEHHNAIVWRYKYQYTFEMMGHEMGLSKQGAQRRTEAAINAIQRALGRRDLGELRNASEPQLRPDGTADALAKMDRTYNG